MKYGGTEVRQNIDNGTIFGYEIQFKKGGIKYEHV